MEARRGRSEEAAAGEQLQKPPLKKSHQVAPLCTSKEVGLMRLGELQGAAAANRRRGGYGRPRRSFRASYEPQPTHHDSLIKYDSNPQVSTLAGRRIEQR